MLEIHLTDLNKQLALINLSNHGDHAEREYYHCFCQTRFPNYENFWRRFVVPITKRLELPPGEPAAIRYRDNLDPRLENISQLHYSVFYNLLRAHQIAELTAYYEFFECFYMHLASACDSAEELLLKLYYLLCDLKGTEPRVVKGLSREEFLQLCAKFFDEDYPRLYEVYLKKGKYIPIKIPHITNILRAFFVDYGRESLFKDYSTIAQAIRTYRNVIVHEPLLGKKLVADDAYSVFIPLVPKKNKVRNYLPWRKVLEQGPSEDFVDMKEQMHEDISALEDVLNELWAFVLCVYDSQFSQPKFYQLMFIDILPEPTG